MWASVWDFHSFHDLGGPYARRLAHFHLVDFFGRGSACLARVNTKTLSSAGCLVVEVTKSTPKAPSIRAGRRKIRRAPRLLLSSPLRQERVLWMWRPRGDTEAGGRSKPGPERQVPAVNWWIRVGLVHFSSFSRLDTRCLTVSKRFNFELL